MRKLIRAALVMLVLVPAAAVLASHGGGGGGGGSHGGGSSHSGGSHGGGSHTGGSHGGWHGSGSHGGFHGGSDHGWHRGGGGWHRGGGWIVYGDPFWGAWGWWGWGCPFFPDCYAPPYVVAGGDSTAAQPQNRQDDWGTIDTDIWPETARVYLDGRYIGAAENFDGDNDYLYLKPGDYTIEFRLRGYEPASIDVSVDPGAKIELNRKLHRKPGTTESTPGIPSEPEGGLRRYWGKEGGKLVPYAGNESRAGNRPASDGADDDDADDAPPPPRASMDSAPAHPDKMSGRLNLSVEPRDAALYLDNQFIGTAAEIGRDGGGIAVAPGSHKITATRPGFKPQTVRVDVAGEGSKDVQIELEK